MGSEPFRKFSTLLDSSAAYKNADSHRHDPFRRVLNMELLQFYYTGRATGELANLRRPGFYQHARNVNQLAQLREFCQQQGWQVPTEYVDHETGSTSARDEFQKMLLHASQRKFDVLLFWALDRLTREGTLATLQYLERLTSYQVGYKSFTEPYLDSCGTFKDIVISLLATMAKQERIRMGERVRAGIAQARRAGKPL